MAMLRRIFAVTSLPVSLFAGIAALTSSDAGSLPSVAKVGERFDSSAYAKILRSQVLGSVRSETGVAAEEAVGEIPEEQLAELRRELLSTVRHEPLNYAAFTALAHIMRSQGDQRFPAFVEAATIATPRTPSLIGMSLSLAAENNDEIRALDLLDRLMRLRPTLVRELMPKFIAQFENDPESYDIKSTLATEPLWAPLFLTLAADSDKLIGSTGKARAELSQKNISNDAIDAKLIRNLAAKGDYDTAWSIYSLHRDAESESAFRFDTQFTPFEWQLTQDASQTVSLLPNNVLEIELLNGGGEAAQQTVRLPLGNWRLSGDISIEGEARQKLIVQAACAQGDAKRQTVSLPLNSSDWSMKLPAGCRYVSISFATERGYATTPTWVSIQNLSISRSPAS